MKLGKASAAITCTFAFGFALACSESSTSDAPSGGSSGIGPDGGGSSSGGSSSGGSSSGSTTSSSGATSDSGTDSGTPLTGNAVRLANLRAEALDICIRTGTTGIPGTFGADQPVFKNGAGIPPGAISRWIAVPDGNIAVFYVAAGSANCDNPLSNNNVSGGSGGNLRLTTVVMPNASQGLVQTAAPVAGKDNVWVWQDSQNVKFTPTAGSPVTTAYRGVTTFDVGVTGELTRDPAAATRAFKTAAGSVTVLASATVLTVCDDDAPPVGDLTKCDDTVRMP